MVTPARILGGDALQKATGREPAAGVSAAERRGERGLTVASMRAAFT